MKTTGEIGSLIEQFAERRRGKCFPPQTRETAERFVEEVLGLLFPQFSSIRDCSGSQIESELRQIESSLISFTSCIREAYPNVRSDIAERFVRLLPEILALLDDDATAIFYGDPAATSVDEVILAYPGFYAIAVHRIAHRLNRLEMPLLPRLLAEYAHQRTGIDIHPGAKIGRSFAIDHGTGIVIGETTEIGNGVKIYQGVTLGALSVDKQLASKKRHPTLEDHVVVYAGATILGGSTVVGHDAIVGANAWITSSVGPFSVVGRNSEVRLRTSGQDDLEFHI